MLCSNVKQPLLESTTASVKFITCLYMCVCVYYMSVVFLLFACNTYTCAHVTCQSKTGYMCVVRWRHLVLHLPSLQARIPCSSRSRILWMTSSMRIRCQRQQLSLQLMNYQLYGCATTRETLQPDLRLRAQRMFHIPSLLHTMKCLQSLATGMVSICQSICRFIKHPLNKLLRGACYEYYEQKSGI